LGVAKEEVEERKPERKRSPINSDQKQLMHHLKLYFYFPSMEIKTIKFFQCNILHINKNFNEKMNISAINRYRSLLRTVPSQVNQQLNTQIPGEDG
jgi:hypothetical protein